LTTILETLLADLPDGWCVTDVYIGVNWVLSQVKHENGLQRAGVAGTPQIIITGSRFQMGHHPLNEDAQAIGQLLLSNDETSAAVGLATLNAVNQPEYSSLVDADAADWLSAQSKGKRIAFFGRFPFIEEEIRPFARQVWVFEQSPDRDELDAAHMSDVLPNADMVAITGSAIINHTIDGIMSHIKPTTLVTTLLGPSTPLNKRLFDCGIDALFGVWVADVERVIESVTAGEGFQKMQGLARKSLFRSNS
jgi:uncharacterized protein (DUF4213/DUF364 family)